MLELLIALAISAGVSLAGWSFYTQQARDLTHQLGNLNGTEALRAATAFIARDIRMAGYDPTSTALSVDGATGVSEAGEHVLHLQFDKNADGIIDVDAPDPLAESILYTYDPAGQRVLRAVAGVTQTLVARVPEGTFSFTYFDEDGSQLLMEGSSPRLSGSSRDAAALVQVRIGVSAGVAPSAPTLEIASSAAIRDRILGRL